MGLLVFGHDGARVKLGQEYFSLEVAATRLQREIGLSGRSKLPGQHGMLFVFDRPGKHCFWMKDTNFSLDIIWLSVQKQIVYTEESVHPDSFPQTFCPNDEALYVIEVPPGTVDASGVKIGDALTF